MERNDFGYEYRYEFWLEDDEIPRPGKYAPSAGVKTLPAGERTFAFEVRTNFIIRKKLESEKIIGSEKFNGSMKETDPDYFVYYMMLDRIKEYWFPEDRIDKFFEEMMSFTRRRAASDPRLVIPVVVGFDVCTVQKPGEAVSTVVERAIRPEHLLPEYLISMDKSSERCASKDLKPEMNWLFIHYLLNIRIRGGIRVEDVDQGLKLMNVCGICGRKPTIGAQIALLLKCKHAFHWHCAVNWMERNTTCPTCGGKEHNYFNPFDIA